MTLTDHARRVLAVAEDEALISSPLNELHVLLALTTDVGDVARLALSFHGIVEDVVRDYISNPQHLHSNPLEQRSFVENAYEHARMLGHSYVGSSHLLLELLRPAYSDVNRFLVICGCEAELIRDEVYFILGRDKPT